MKLRNILALSMFLYTGLFLRVILAKTFPKTLIPFPVKQFVSEVQLLLVTLDVFIFWSFVVLYIKLLVVFKCMTITYFISCLIRGNSHVGNKLFLWKSWLVNFHFYIRGTLKVNTAPEMFSLFIIKNVTLPSLKITHEIL